jgi:DNA-binding NarL/FixJ family response regulator
VPTPELATRAVDNGRVRRVSSPTFVGRAEQLAAFDHALARAAAEEPGALLVAGESGVGKSRLVAEFAERARAAGARVLTGDCVELGEGELPYAPIVGALRELQRELGTDAVIELAGQGRAELARLLPEAGEPAAARDAEFAQSRLFELLLSLLGRVGEQAPLVLVIEDLHWADRSTRDFLSFLLRATRGERLVLVATYRSDELHRRHPLRPFLANIERLDGVGRVEVQPFSRLELSAQLLGILGSHPESTVADALFQRSGGNPFFAEELLAATAEGNGHALPETLRDALMVRVETLSPTTQQLLRVIAAAGRSVTHGLLSAVTAVEQPQLADSLREALTHHVLVQRPGDDRYSFRHALMREAVYEDLLPGERGDLHVRLAEALEANPDLSADSVGPAGELAWHWHQAHELPHALRASIEASAQAERMHAPVDAARHVENALELWDRVADPEASSGTTLLELLRRGAELSFVGGEMDRAVGLARRALELIDDSDVVTTVLARERLARYLWTSGHHSESMQQYTRAAELMPVEPPTAERALVLGALAQARMLVGQIEVSLELAEEAIEIARAVGDRAVESHALNTLGVDIGALGDRERGIAALRESLAIELERLSSDDLHRAYTNLGDMLDQDGQIEDAIQLALEGVEMARETGTTRSWAGFLLAEAAKRCWRLGRLADADRLLRQALDFGAEGVSGANVHLATSELAMLLGRWDQAEDQLAEARRLLSRAAGSMWIGPLYGCAVMLAEHQGDIAAARRAVEEAQRRMENEDEFAFYARDLYLPALRAEGDAAERARAAHDREAEDEAHKSGAALRARLRQMVAAAGVRGSPPPQVVADEATAEAELARIEGSPDAALWEAAAEANEQIGNRVEAAYARMRKAEVLLETGADRDAVTETLRAAHGVAAECGAEVLRERCETLARRARVALSDEPAPATVEDPFGLTPREREVLVLVAAGRTNRQIGEELFMSEKTASVHVSRILAKLEVSTRGEAGAVAHRLGMDA